MRLIGQFLILSLSFLLLVNCDPKETEPECAVSFDYQPIDGRVLKLTASSPHDSIEVYYWDFGDGTEYATTNPTATYQYQEDGKYSISLKARLSNGCEAVYEEEVHIGPEINCLLKIEKLSSNGLFIQLQAVDTFTTTSIKAFYWDMGDGSDVIEASAPLHSYIYNAPGDYKVHCEMHTFGGCVAKDSVEVSITPNISDCQVTLAQTGSTKQTFTFEPTLTNSPQSKSFTYDFGDGTPALKTQNTDQVSHTYGEAGDYIVKVTFYDATSECSSSDTVHISVSEPTDCSIEVSTATVSGQEVSLDANVTALGNYTVIWYYPDGQSDILSNSTSTSHIFDSGYSGEQTIKVRLIGQDGCGGNDEEIVDLN